MTTTQNPESRRTHRWTLFFLALILLSALALRYRGVAWARLHPDEPTIAQWASSIEERSYISDRFYAGGYFQLVKPILWVRRVLSDAGADWRTFQGYGARWNTASVDMILFLRTTNLWLAVLTVGLFYFLAKRATGSRGAALAAAGFLALARLHVEHSHYGETDIAMVFTLTLALCAWARMLDGGRLGWFLAAAFLSGWAIGTKFPISTLFVNVLAGAVIAGTRGAGPGKSWRTLLLVLAGVVLCLAAVVYTNQGMLNFKWFWPQVTQGLSSVYNERAGLLGDSAVNPHAAWISNVDTLLKGLADVGWIWSALMLVGLVFALTPSYRRFWPVTILFPMSFAGYFIFVAPWTRGQEFMAFFPSMAVWIAIGVKELTECGARLVPRAAAAALAAAIVLAAMAGSGVIACRTASLFGWPDPRVQALQWLYLHAPLDAMVGTEKYTAPVDHLFALTTDIDQVEWQTPDQLRDAKLDYLVRNVTSKGRGTVAPHTLEMYPRFAANLHSFETNAHRLCQWGAIGDPLYMFAGHRIEWWDARPISPAAEFTLPLFRAVCLRRDPFVMVPETAGSFGSAPGMYVDRYPRQFVLNGPASDTREAYVVLQTAERPADVIVTGSGCCREVALAPYDVAIVPIRRPAFWPRLQEYDVIKIRARPVEHIEYIPCYANVSLSVSEAAMLAFQKGYADRALAFLKAEDACRRPDTAWLAYACAVETGDWVLATELETPAREMLGRMEKARATKPADLLINDYSGVALLDHCRLRMPFLTDAFVGTSAFTLPPIQLDLKKNEDRPNGFEATWRLPARLARGQYQLQFTLAAPRSMAFEGSWRMSLSDDSNTNIQEIAVDARTSLAVVRNVEVKNETDFSFTLRSAQRAGCLELNDVELRWAGGDVLAAEREALAAAIRNHAAHKDAGPAAVETPGLLFYPWLKLVAQEADASTGGQRCVFEVLRDEVPPLTLKAWSNRKAKRKPYFSAPLNAGAVARGQRLELVVPPAPEGQGDGVWMRVEASVRWAPGVLRVEGSDSDLVKIK